MPYKNPADRATWARARRAAEKKRKTSAPPGDYLAVTIEADSWDEGDAPGRRQKLGWIEYPDGWYAARRSIAVVHRLTPEERARAEQRRAKRRGPSEPGSSVTRRQWNAPAGVGKRV